MVKITSLDHHFFLEYVVIHKEKMMVIFYLNFHRVPWPVWLNWMKHHPVDRKVMGLISVGADPQVAGLTPSWACVRRQPIDVSLPPPSCLSEKQ